MTTFSQLVADRFGVPLESVEVIHGDTMVSPLGMDTYGSRSLTVGGVSLWQAADKIVAKAKEIVAHQFEVDAADLRESSGTFTLAGTDKTMTVAEAAFAAWTAHNLPDGMEPGLEASAVYDPANFSWPGGTHIAVVEVDTETGSVDLRRYVAVDDLGVVVNPIDRRRTGCRRDRAGRRGGALRGGGLRRRGEPADVEHGHVHGALGCGAAELRDRPHGDARHGQPARGEGGGGDGNDRLAACRDERPRRRAFSVRRLRHRHARHARSGSGAHWRRHDDSRQVRLRGRRIHRARARAARLARRREAPRRRPLADSGDEAPNRTAGVARRYRSRLRRSLTSATRASRWRSGH